MFQCRANVSGLCERVRRRDDVACWGPWSAMPRTRNYGSSLIAEQSSANVHHAATGSRMCSGRKWHPKYLVSLATRSCDTSHQEIIPWIRPSHYATIPKTLVIKIYFASPSLSVPIPPPHEPTSSAPHAPHLPAIRALVLLRRQTQQKRVPLRLIWRCSIACDSDMSCQGWKISGDFAIIE